MSLPSNDTDAWYYPAYGFEPNDEDLPQSAFRGNWGIKTYNEAKWVRKGKMTAWGPWMEDWEVRASLSWTSWRPTNHRCSRRIALGSVYDNCYHLRKSKTRL